MNPHYPTCLNEENIEEVTTHLRKLMYGQLIFYYKVEWADSNNASSQHYLAELNSAWGDACTDQIRLFRKGARDNPIDCSYISFSLASYCISFNAAPGNRRDHYGFDDQPEERRLSHRHPTVCFDQNFESVTFKDRAPAGKGCLHHYVFTQVPLMRVRDHVEHIRHTLPEEEVRDYLEHKPIVPAQVIPQVPAVRG